MVSLPRGLRNNNPGNIEDGAFAQSLPGYVGSDGRFAVFDSLDSGAYAMQKLLSGYGKKGLNTVEQVINRWAPPTENDTGSYAKTVAAQLGVKPGDKIDLSDPQTLSALSSAMAGVENGRPVALGYVDPQVTTAYRNDSAGAVDAMANGALKPNLVQSVQYVPPPGSNQQGQFTPLLATDVQPAASSPQPQQQPEQPIERTPLPSAGQSVDVLKQWGLDAAPAQTTPAAQSPAPQPQGNDALIKAWGLDKTDAAPAETAAKASEQAPAKQTPQSETPSTFDDVIKSGASGFARGALDLIGLPATIQNAFDNSLSAITGIKAPPPSPLSGNSLRAAAERATSGATEYQPQTTPGKFAGSAGEAIPASLLGPENVLMNAVKFGVVPGLASEAAGQLTAGAPIEPYARVGAALLSPVAAEGIIRGAATAGNKLSALTPRGAASANLTDALSASGMAPSDVANELARNPRLNAMDIDPNLQQMGMNLANQGGAPRSILNQVVEQRMAGAKDAVTGAFDEALGATPDVKAYLDNLKSTAQANGKVAFGDALDNAKPVNISPVLDAIDAKISPGIQSAVSKGSGIPQGPVEQALARVRGQLASGDEMLTDAQRLHQIQSDLRVQADTLSSSASGQDKLVGSALRDIRQKIINSIDDASGGKYRPAQQQYADDMSINDAFDRGRQILAGGTSSDSALQNRPEFWKAWVADASQPEIDAAKVGARVAIDNQINSVRSAAAKGAAVPDVGFNRDRLATLLGKNEADKLAQTLKDEQRIAQTNAKLFAGSQTAPRQAVNKLTEIQQVSPSLSLSTPIAIGGGYGVGGLPGAAAGAALSLGKMGVQAAQRARDITRNRLMAEALSGNVTQFQNAFVPQNRLVQALGGAQTPLLSSAVPSTVGTVSNQLTERNRLLGQ